MQPFVRDTLILLKCKPRLYLISAALFTASLILIKWNLHPDWSIIWFILGSIIGIYFLDFAEHFFKLNPSPFRSVIFQALFLVVSLFIITSAGSFLASGLVLNFYLQLVLLEVGEWQLTGSVHNWYRLLPESISPKSEKIGALIFIAGFVGVTILFLR